MLEIRGDLQADELVAALQGVFERGGCGVADGDLGGRHRLSLHAERLFELTRRVQIFDDVTTAHELSFDVELRDRGPIREIFDALAYVCVCQDVDRRVVLQHGVQNLDYRRGEPALR